MQISSKNIGGVAGAIKGSSLRRQCLMMEMMRKAEWTPQVVPVKIKDILSTAGTHSVILRWKSCSRLRGR